MRLMGVESPQATAVPGETSPEQVEGGRQWRRRARTRAKLLSAARELIAERGVDGVTMLDVTTAADMGAGTVYNYFASVQELTTALIHAEIDFFGGRLDALAGGLSDPAEVYAASLRHLVRHAMGDPLWGRFYVQLGVAHPLVLEVLGPRCRRDLQAGVDAGRFGIEDLDLAVACTFGALAAVLDLVTSTPERADTATRYAAGMLRMVGVPADEAREIASRPLPDLVESA